ncbi:MAG: aldo/keto reductase [Sutterella wadsworthensis]|nr:aldo/keto reductase [Sutterella wadsworthensis]
MERIEPSNSVKMPAMNFGVYWITDPTECEAAVLSAWRGIDTAASYLNERAVGRAVARSGIPCSELFISTKLWVQDTSEAGAERAIRRSLELLRTDTIDLYLIHQPYGDIYGAWRTMERFYEAGALRAIGVSNFQPDRITDFALHQRIRPTVNQIEVNPFCQQREADAVNRALGVMPSAWAPFAEGRDGLLENPVLRAQNLGPVGCITNRLLIS